MNVSVAWARKMILFLVFASVTLVRADVVNVECSPADEVNCSNLYGYGRIEGIIKDPAVDFSKSEAIYCQIQGKLDLLRFEWVFVGEPPRLVEFETDKEIMTELHEATVVCPVSDISVLDRPPPSKMEERYQSGIGNVTYSCKGSSNIKILFTGMRMLNKDLRLLTGSLGPSNVQTQCVSNSKFPEGKQSEQLGRVCPGGYRYMYDESGEFVCAPCCEDYYWSKVFGQCKECSSCYTNEDPNIWTSCKTVKECTVTVPVPGAISDPPTQPPASTSTGPTSATTTTTTAQPLPKTTTKAPSPPSLAPRNVTITEVGSAHVALKWDDLGTIAVDEYIVTVSLTGTAWSHDTRTNDTQVEISGLTPNTHYEVTMCGINSAGQGPRTDPLSFKTLGTVPQSAPSNIVISRKHKRVIVTWDTIIGTHTGDEEPILGVMIEYWVVKDELPTNVSFLVSNKTSSAEFVLEQYGTYEIYIYSYNKVGSGPAEKFTEDFEEETPASGWYALILIALEVIVIGVAQYFENKRIPVSHPVSSS